MARAARLAGELAPESGLSLRQIKAVQFKVRMACVVYAERPIDVALLVWLGFREAAGMKRDLHNLPAWVVSTSQLPRASLSPDAARKVIDKAEKKDETRWGQESHVMSSFVQETCPELKELPDARYPLPDDQNYFQSWRVLHFLAPHYIPDHEAMLAHVHKFAAPGTG